MGLILLVISSACGPSGSQVNQPADPSTDAPAAATTAPTATEAVVPGTERNNPAALTEKVTSKNWEFTAVEVVRGDQALTILKDASSFNKAPDDDTLEYVLVKVRVKSLDSNTEQLRVDGTFFESTGNADVMYERPSILDVRDPEPILQAELMPGEEFEGWVTILAGKGETGLVLIIQPRVNGNSTGESDKRYISLEP